MPPDIARRAPVVIDLTSDTDSDADSVAPPSAQRQRSVRATPAAMDAQSQEGQERARHQLRGRPPVLIDVENYNPANLWAGIPIENPNDIGLGQMPHPFMGHRAQQPANAIGGAEQDEAVLAEGFPAHHEGHRMNEDIDRELAEAMQHSEDERRTVADDDADSILQEVNHTCETCLQHVSQVFPGIKTEYVEKLYTQYSEVGGELQLFEAIPPSDRATKIVQHILDSNEPYPTEEVKVDTKRKRENSPKAEDFDEWTAQHRGTLTSPQKEAVRGILVAAFPSLLQAYIKETLGKKKHLFPTYLALAETATASNGLKKDVHRLRDNRSAPLKDPERLAQEASQEIFLEYLAATRYVQNQKDERIAKQQKIEFEAENLKSAREANQLVMCHICFDDEVPMNRAIYCQSDGVHFTCFECAEKYIEVQISQRMCEVVCSGEDCGAGYLPSQLRSLPNQKAVERLERLLQQQCLREANIEGLEACPFCDYQAILEEGQNHFQCYDDECGELSCRLCKKKSHIPLTCKEFADSKKTNTRNEIAERMSEALIRKCNKCKTPFLKSEGCNKMTCPNCSNAQCYLCNINVHAYEHFFQGRPPRPAHLSDQCYLFDEHAGETLDQRHYREVEDAEKKAKAEAIAKNPELKEDDIKFATGPAPVARAPMVAQHRRQPLPLDPAQVARYAAHHYPPPHAAFNERAVERMRLRNVQEAAGLLFGAPDPGPGLLQPPGRRAPIDVAGLQPAQAGRAAMDPVYADYVAHQRLLHNNRMAAARAQRANANAAAAMPALEAPRAVQGAAGAAQAPAANDNAHRLVQFPAFEAGAARRELVQPGEYHNRARQGLAEARADGAGQAERPQRLGHAPAPALPPVPAPRIDALLQQAREQRARRAQEGVRQPERRLNPRQRREQRAAEERAHQANLVQVGLDRDRRVAEQQAALDAGRQDGGLVVHGRRRPAVEGRRDQDPAL